MPFYLVTHTALAEADDEVGAAEKVLVKLQADTRVAFTVKFDETSIKQVTIKRCDERAVERQPEIGIVDGKQSDMPAEKIAAANQLAANDGSRASLSVFWRGAALLAAACFVGWLFFLSLP